MPSDHKLLNEILKGALFGQSMVDYKLGIPSEQKYSRHGQVKINGRIPFVFASIINYYTFSEKTTNDFTTLNFCISEV